MHRKTTRIVQACELSEPTLCYISINSRELCPEQVCKLSRACELARSNYLGYIVLSCRYCRWLNPVLVYVTSLLFPFFPFALSISSTFPELFPAFAIFLILSIHLFSCLFFLVALNCSVCLSKPFSFQSIMSYNGAAVVAMRGKDCVAIASDRRFGIQIP